ncbi:MAG: histidine kinase dimerization/phospho-acceptor domain-containing protein [Chloroflexota bacterium]
MSPLEKITISVPPQLFEAGLTEADIHGTVNRWLVISLFQQQKITAAEAGQLLTTDEAGFLNLLNKLGILYGDGFTPDKNQQDVTTPHTSPVLTDLTDAQDQIDHLEENLADIKYQLSETQRELKNADRVRSEFLATVSHELRTPLNSIIGFAKLLLKQQIGPLNEIQVTDLSVIFNSAQHLLNLVNDILDLSKIDAGKMRLDMSWHMIEEIITGVMASTLILIEDKPIRLEERIQPNLPKLFVDRVRIRQVVLNILSNAAKFTDLGTIAFHIYRTNWNGEDSVCFSVRDTGIGIADEDKEKVF